MHTKRLSSLAIMALVLFGMLGALWALCPDEYNRPNPLMDYVPQEIGVYDSGYQTLTESECRGCHGESTADRHHYTPLVLEEGNCLTCHPPCEPGTADCPNGTLIRRDCLASGCHSWDDVPTNGWHHDTDLLAPRNCVRCHNPNLIDEIGPFRDHEMYPPAVVGTLPCSCENCHWEQQHSATGDPNNPGHPSTYDHYDVWDQFVGFHEYSRPISPSSETHHMGGKSGITSECDKCHGAVPDSEDSDWDPYNLELIRYCVTCHSIRTLHEIFPHIYGGNGWEPIGFHVPLGNDDCTDESPNVYRTWNPTGPYAPEATPGFTADHHCSGCHDEAPVPWDPELCCCQPAIGINIAGIQPTAGSCGTIVTLRGECFGEEHPASRVQFKKKPDGDLWIDVPIHSWADTFIELEVPCWTFATGNYWVRVKTPSGHSNERVFSFWGG